MRRLWIKDDTGNPTHSFKDRVVAVALAAAQEMGFKVLACPSTGNLANAVAAAGSRSIHAAAKPSRRSAAAPRTPPQRRRCPPGMCFLHRRICGHGRRGPVAHRLFRARLHASYRLDHFVKFAFNLGPKVGFYLVHLPELGKCPAPMRAEMIHTGHPIGVHG